MSLTPKQAFDVVKLLWTKTAKIVKINDGLHKVRLYSDAGIIITNLTCDADIQWPAGVTEYPEPAPKWRDVVPSDLVWPWPEVRVKKNNPEATEWRKHAYLCSIMYNPEGELLFGCTDGNTYVAAQIREKA